MLDSMNLPDKTRVTFAGRLVFVYFSSKNAESGVFYCRLQIFEIVEVRYKLPTIFFSSFLSENCELGQTVCFKLFNTWSSRCDKQVKTARL